ncbi:MAG: DUF1016 family protein [Planctomycetes bacterium]|nr:DUF1016 family protein [Planctomycetota bacterium]
MNRDLAIQQLRKTLGKVRPDSPNPLCRQAAEIRDAKDQVLSRYQPAFSTEHIGNLAADEFRSFLLFRNNHHWDSIHRQGGLMTSNMEKLREALAWLVDESRSLRERLDALRPNNGDPMVKGLGRAVLTAILQVVYPDDYGVLNKIAEDGMVKLGLWPKMPRGASFGERYERVNSVLLEVADQVGVDLWTLDMLWWRFIRSDEPEEPSDEQGNEVGSEAAAAAADLSEARFGLERHLHEFLVDNWEKTGLGQEWELVEEEGDIVGSHYNTREVGEIDILAKHRCDGRWLVVELKRDQSSDTTVGQVLRYMGWVRRRKAEPGSHVEGLIICRNIDARLQYALDGQTNVQCMTYQVSFALSDAPGVE